jgi:hypothetical protein
MSLLAEEIVEEWLNRQGYFTIRGIKLGVHEIDLLAIKSVPNSTVECRHLEVQASMRPVSYISKVPRKGQKAGRAANSAKRTDEELLEGVAEWVETKFTRPDKRKLLQLLWPGRWSSELVVNIVKEERELDLIAQHGINIIRLFDIVRELDRKDLPVKSAAGCDFIELIQMGANQQSPSPLTPRKLAAKAGS